MPLTKLNIEKAIIPTATPPIPHRRADLALESFSASPFAIKNKAPAARMKIIPIPKNMIHVAFIAPRTTDSKLTFPPEPALYNCAKAGKLAEHPIKVNATKDIMDNALFFLDI